MTGVHDNTIIKRRDTPTGLLSAHFQLKVNKIVERILLWARVLLLIELSWSPVKERYVGPHDRSLFSSFIEVKIEEKRLEH